VGVLFSSDRALAYSSSRSERLSSSSERSSQNGKRPVASSTRVIPSDQISDFTEYSAP